jgi:hypothetical protein
VQRIVHCGRRYARKLATHFRQDLVSRQMGLFPQQNANDCPALRSDAASRRSEHRAHIVH